MVEGFVIAVAGAGAALFLAHLLTRFLVAFLDSGSDPVSLDVHPDWRVFAFTASWALLTCLLFALAPALRATRAHPGDALKSGVRGTPGRDRFGLRRILVATQIALSLVLMVSALLFVRSLRNLMTVEAGFQGKGVLMATASYGGLNASPARLAVVRHDLVERIRAIPGVESAAETAFLPADGGSWTNMMWMDGSDVTHAREVSRGLVGPGYFHAIRTPLVAGREFDARDTSTSQNVAIVSEAFARTFSLGSNPVGQRFWIEKAPYAPQSLYEIVGVAKNSKFHDLRQDFPSVIFIPMSQFPQPLLYGRILIRSRAKLDVLTPSIRRAIAEVNPNIGYFFSVFEDRIAQSLLRERLMAILSSLFGGLAVLLATVGLYGVISYMVARRTGEIGIRIALGASSANVIRLILSETVMLLAIGISAGMMMAIAVGPSGLGFAVRPAAH